MDLTLTPGQWAVVAAAALTCGMAKAGVAGLGVVLVPVLAQVFPAKQSVGILLPMLIAGDLLGVMWYRRHVVWGELARCLPLAAAGILAGYFGMRHFEISNLALRHAIGATVLVMLALSFWQGRHARRLAQAAGAASAGESANGGALALDAPGAPAPTSRGREWRTWALAAVFGLAGGAASMLANAAGPLFVMYLLFLGLKKDNFIGTHAFLFLLINLIKAPLQWDLGNITPETLLFDLKTVPLIALGFVLGRQVVKRLSQRWFVALVRLLTAAAALKLFW
ncbi:MAG: sulfite exporter TauE/SafE family protein [Planctomycetes bacterium]|nr:sulfite exporter TauE/SafE family protein [Planctomycetota bacterium]